MSTNGPKRPITAAQAEARRNNGKQHSTGPRTDTGKQASSRNAIKHGLWAKANPVIDTGIFAEDPSAYEELRAGIHGCFRSDTPLMAELVDSLASVLWRLKRIPAIEALLLQEEDSIEDRRADRNRERLEEILFTERYLREGGHDLDERGYYTVMGELHIWAGWPYAEGWDVDDDVLVGVVEQVELADRLLRRKFASWDAAADHGRALAEQMQESLHEPQLEFAIARAKRLIEMEMLSKLNRPEAHLARERDRLLAQIRMEEARFRPTDDEDEQEDF
jgi:hypothetical protein